MQISQTKPYSPKFGALHIANAGNLQIYKLTDSADKKFIKNLASSVNMCELMPNLGKEEADRWNEMLSYAVDNAQCPENITYIETLNNKACGIITFRPGNTSFLDCICTWPIEVGKKVKLAGKTLFFQMFKDVQALKSKKLKLEAITNGPYNTVKKYEELGFKQTSSVFPTKVIMETNSSKLKDTFHNLSGLIDYEPVKPQKINLSRMVD